MFFIPPQKDSFAFCDIFNARKKDIGFWARSLGGMFAFLRDEITKIIIDRPGSDLLSLHL